VPDEIVLAGNSPPGTYFFRRRRFNWVNTARSFGLSALRTFGLPFLTILRTAELRAWR
jgi:hypothetical protein